MAQARKRQKFFPVALPLIDKETQLYGYSIEEFNGKTVIYDLTRLLRGKSMTLRLEVEVKDGKATTHPIELKVMPQFIRRMMRKGTNYVEDSFSTPCKNGTVKIKPFLLTRKKVSRRVRKALREKCREELINYLKDKNSKDLFDEVMANKIQKHLSMVLKKIYPLSMCEIKTFKVEKEGLAPDTEGITLAEHGDKVVNPEEENEESEAPEEPKEEVKETKKKVVKKAVTKKTTKPKKEVKEE